MRWIGCLAEARKNFPWTWLTNEFSFLPLLSVLRAYLQRFKVTDVFAQQLLQLKGMSESKAKCVVAVYESPRALAAAYDRLSLDTDPETAVQAMESMLKNLIDPGTGNKLGLVISRAIFQFFRLSRFD